MSWNEAEGNKINEQISKLEVTNGDLGLKIAANKIRMRNLVGKLAGVKTGDVVVWKGQRYQVVEILSESAPKKGKPVLSGLKIAKNGNLAKRPVEIKGAWNVEGSAPKEIVRVSSRRKKPAKKIAAAPVKRRGRQSKKALEDVTVLGTA
jgi:hypothetical protein